MCGLRFLHAVKYALRKSQNCTREGIRRGFAMRSSVLEIVLHVVFGSRENYIELSSIKLRKGFHFRDSLVGSLALLRYSQ